MQNLPRLVRTSFRWLALGSMVVGSPARAQNDDLTLAARFRMPPPKGTLRGKVIDAATKQGIVGVVVSISSVASDLPRWPSISTSVGGVPTKGNPSLPHVWCPYDAITS